MGYNLPRFATICVVTILTVVMVPRQASSQIRPDTLPLKRSKERIARRVDSMHGDMLSWRIRDIMWSCSSMAEGANVAFHTDSNLLSMYRQVEARQLTIGDDTAQWALRLLAAAQRVDDTACLLPFIRLIDPKADAIYVKECRTRPDGIPFYTYCKQMPVTWLTLMYLEYAVLQRVTIPSTLFVDALVLEKLDRSDPMVRRWVPVYLRSDLLAVCKIYFQWFERGNSHGNPFNANYSDTTYRWRLALGR